MNLSNIELSYDKVMMQNTAIRTFKDCGVVMYKEITKERTGRKSKILGMAYPKNDNTIHRRFCRWA